MLVTVEVTIARHLADLLVATGVTVQEAVEEAVRLYFRNLDETFDTRIFEASQKGLDVTVPLASHAAFEAGQVEAVVKIG